jgi:hypothetical protein
MQARPVTVQVLFEQQGWPAAEPHGVQRYVDVALS